MIHSWIKHYIAHGAGPSTLFIAMSCAKYHCPDIERLLNDRFYFPCVGNRLKKDQNNNGVSTVTNVNNYTIVVREYFQKAIKNWRNTVGKNVFKINHYLVRFKYAPSRGQIHAHVLVIMDHNTLFKGAMNALKSTKNMSNFLAE